MAERHIVWIVSLSKFEVTPIHDKVLSSVRK